MSVSPLILPASAGWGGNDGNWSLFSIAVGSPPQSFAVLPKTSGGEAWIPGSEACLPGSISNCTASRGIRSGAGINVTASTTWSLIGIYNLESEDSLFGQNNNGLYGFDTLSIGDGNETNLTRQLVAEIATPDFWLGNFGLGIEQASFDVESQDIPSMMQSMMDRHVIPSLSYGYSAGASYRNASAGLIIGGYDAEAFTPSDLEFMVSSNGSQPLMVNLRSLVLTNTLQGTVDVPINSSGLSIAIDSTVSQMWLPLSICNALQSALQLQYDESTGLYLVNSSTHDQLLAANPGLTFALGSHGTSNATTNIVFPYAAFDLQASYPMYNSSTAYFPLRRALNASQYVLGRVFLQEAYLVVDWARGNFTLGQSRHIDGVSGTVVPISAPSTTAVAHLGLSIGPEIGMVIGVVSMLATVGCISVIVLRQWKMRHRIAGSNPETAEAQSDEKTQAIEKDGNDTLYELGTDHTAHCIMSQSVHEMDGKQTKHMIMSQEIFELPGHIVEQELSCNERPIRKSIEGSIPQ